MFYIQNALTTSNSAKTACNLGGEGENVYTQPLSLKLMMIKIKILIEA